MNRKNTKFLQLAILSMALSLFLTISCKSDRQSTRQKLNMELGVAQPNPYFLFISDIHLNHKSSSSDFNCDTGTDLWDHFVSKATTIINQQPPPMFIIVTGDLPAHLGPSKCKLTDTGNLTDHRKNDSIVLSELRTLADLNKIPLFFLPGNNDALNGDYQTFANANGITPFILSYDKKNLFPALNCNPAGGKFPCLVSYPDTTMGYYSVSPLDGLKIIAMNTVMFSSNFSIATNYSFADRDKQMKWLTNELAASAAKKNERVYIAMHIPPGTDYNKSELWMQESKPATSWQNEFLKLVAAYDSIIAGILFGHTHMEEVRVLYAPQSKNITEVAISCPGITPIHGNYPGFKTVEFNSSNMELMNYTTYYTTPSAQSWGNSSYTFNLAFGNNQTTTIHDCVVQLGLNSLISKLTPIYLVNHPGSLSSVSNGVEVDWEY